MSITSFTCFLPNPNECKDSFGMFDVIVIFGDRYFVFFSSALAFLVPPPVKSSMTFSIIIFAQKRFKPFAMRSANETYTV